MIFLFLAPVSKLNHINIGLLAERNKNFYQARFHATTFSHHSRSLSLLPPTLSSAHFPITTHTLSLHKHIATAVLMPSGAHPALPGSSTGKDPPIIENEAIAEDQEQGKALPKSKHAQTVQSTLH